MLGNKVFLILLVASGLLQLSKSEDISGQTSSSVSEVNDPYPAWRLMWNLLGINLFLLCLVYTVISIGEKFYLEKRGFYDFEMEDWRMD